MILAKSGATFKKVYKIEIITNDSSETLLKEFYLTTWADTHNKIIDIKNLQLDNIKIDIFKNNINDLEYLGDFNKVRTGEKISYKIPKMEINTKPIKKLSIISTLILLFPLFVLLEITKSKEI
jgi:hypothetical protein